MTIGVETDSLVGLSNFKCLQSNGYTEAVVRAYQTVGRVDPTFGASTVNARDAGLAVDTLIQVTSQTSATAASDVAQRIKDEQLTVQTTWLLVEDPARYWGSGTSGNRTVFTNLVTACEAAGLSVGVYASADSWTQAFGADFTDHSALPLLYGHYDGKRDFKDFTSFGGWTSPARKGYGGGVSHCGVPVVSFTWRP
ncbi:hypothetical protein [Streptomyces sp. NPDC088727]|uniref:hypothetical protein n=1 Tax=Streptomyces sp. NPDC088727 TaxID=3365875 RepID=UPI00381F7A3E